MLKRFETLANAYASEDVVFVNAVGKVFEGKKENFSKFQKNSKLTYPRKSKNSRR